MAARGETDEEYLRRYELEEHDRTVTTFHESVILAMVNKLRSELGDFHFHHKSDWRANMARIKGMIACTESACEAIDTATARHRTKMRAEKPA